MHNIKKKIGNWKTRLGGSGEIINEVEDNSRQRQIEKNLRDLHSNKG